MAAAVAATRRLPTRPDRPLRLPCCLVPLCPARYLVMVTRFPVHRKFGTGGAGRKNDAAIAAAGTGSTSTTAAARSDRRFVPSGNAPAAIPDGAGAALNNPSPIFAPKFPISFILWADSSIAWGGRTEAGPGFPRYGAVSLYPEPASVNPQTAMLSGRPGNCCCCCCRSGASRTFRRSSATRNPPTLRTDARPAGSGAPGRGPGSGGNAPCRREY